MTNKIEPFYLEGSISEVNIEQEKDRVESFVRTSMRDEGFAEVLDIDPQWQMTYDFTNSVFDFKLTMYGVEVEDASQWAGWMNGKLIKRYSPTPK
jgi:hypothetical protein